MKVEYRSSTTKNGRRMAGARSLWRASGMTEEQIDKPVIAIANSFTQFVPGHVHLHQVGQDVKNIIEESGAFAAEFNTMAICDGIAMGHDGMLYSLPSRELIADTVEYMCNAHKVDALVCISNCDKITPGMAIAAMRLNIPTIFVSGGPMEAGKVDTMKLDLVDAMVMGADDSIDDETIDKVERSACPTCGSCSGMFTANSMNCLTEALGLSLPGNGTVVATHENRKELFNKAARRIVEMTEEYYVKGNDKVLPRSIATREAFKNAMSLDIAMGGSTNTVLHLLAIAASAEVDFNMDDMDELSRKVPILSKVSPNKVPDGRVFHIEDCNRAGGIMGILGELERGGLLDTSVNRADGLTLGEAIDKYDIKRDTVCAEADEIYKSAPGCVRSIVMGSQNMKFKELDSDRANGCTRDIENCFDTEGGLAVLFGNIALDGCIVKTAGVDKSIYNFSGNAKVYHSQDAAVDAILNDEIVKGDIVIITFEGPKGGPGMQEMLYPTSYLKSKHLGADCALLTDGRFSGGTSGLSIGHASPEAAAGGTIGLVKTGDVIEISIPNRSINLMVSDEELAKRRKEEESYGDKAFTPRDRDRKVSDALKLFGMFAASADKGAMRVLK